MTGPQPPSRIAPQPWMVEPSTRGVLDALAAGGEEARFVGGVVRGTLLGLPIGGAGARTDIDIATPAPPERVVELLETADPAAALGMMAEDGVLGVILPEAQRLDRLRRMIAIEQMATTAAGLGRDPLRRLAALIAVDAAGAQGGAGPLAFFRGAYGSLAPTL